jgi:ankyrin repeat protein
MRLPDIRILFALALLFISGNVYPQVTEDTNGYYDTTEYIPSFYKGALDYNLMIAASKGYTLEINRLIMKGADIFSETDEGVTPLVFAISDNQTQVAKMLIDYGSDINKLTAHYETPLLIAVKNQNIEITEALLRAGADVNFADRHEATPLHYAAVYDYFQLADMLLYYDASIDVKTVDGSTPLFASTWAGNADIADLLIQNGANMEVKDNEGFTPFLMAALNGDSLIMDLLFKKGVDIYATNASNHNALALTIIADKIEATRYLLKIGNKWSNQGSNSVSPYTVASKYRRKDMIRILEENKIPGNIKYEIDQVNIMVSGRFFIHDIYTGVSFAFKEPFLNAGILVGIDTKIWDTRVLVKQSEHMFYQYWSKGSVFYTGLFKDFALTDKPFSGNFMFSASLSAGYSFGNELKGTNNNPEDKFKIIPALAFKWTKKNLSFNLGADYMKTEFYHTGSVSVRLGASYTLYFDKVRTKSKTLKWY